MSLRPTKPAILLVAAEAHQERMVAEMSHRYAHDYDIVVCSTSASAVSEATARLSSVALVCATPRLPDGSALDLFAAVHAVVPTARRICFLGFDEYVDALEELRVAAAEGRIDTWLGIPRGPRDEEFHAAITEILSDWTWSSQSVGVDGVQIVSPPKLPETARIVDFLQRMGIPHRRYAPDSAVGVEIMNAAGPGAGFPVIRALRGEVMARPSLADLGSLIYGRVSDLPDDHVADLLVVGSGPAGLAAAVYGASEGLRTVVLEAEAVGGQAGTSSMIRNYLGFPRGISGMRLAQRARMQATRFGARFFVGTPVASLKQSPKQSLTPGTPHTVLLEDGSTVRATAIVIATGASYRRLEVAGVESLVGRGVHYGAATSVARDTTDRTVFIVGGGNSAGQAAIHLARFAARVTILIRRSSLADTMSDYLIRELRGNPRIVVQPFTSVTGGGGEGRLQWLTLTDALSSVSTRVDADALMLLLGAEPCVSWLPDSICRDDRGFVQTGRDVPPAYWSGELPPESLATCVPGIFAAGDIRSGSMKRVASASGEGAAVVPLVHAYLAELAELADSPNRA